METSKESTKDNDMAVKVEEKSTGDEAEGIMTDEELKRMDELLEKYDKLVAFIPRFEHWKTLFTAALNQNISQESLQNAYSWTERVLVLLNALNNEFNTYFKKIPYQHPWFQKNEMQVVYYIIETTALHEKVLGTYKEAAMWLNVSVLRRLLTMRVPLDPKEPTE